MKRTNLELAVRWVMIQVAEMAMLFGSLLVGFIIVGGLMSEITSDGKPELLYGLEDQERLDNDPWDTVDRVVDGEPDSITWPVKVLEFRRMTVSGFQKQRMAEAVLDTTLETLDEEFGDPDKENTRSTSAQQDAAVAFIESVVKEYQVWPCEPTGVVIEYTRAEYEGK
jgi:hypothetical protein